VFEVPPRDDMGLLACNVAFQLPRLWKDHPLAIAEKIVAKLDRSSFLLVGDVRVAGPGFINFYAAGRYASLVLAAIAADGPHYGRGDALYARVVEIWFYGHANPSSSLEVARATALTAALARLYRFHGDRVRERPAPSHDPKGEAAPPDDLIAAIASSRAARDQAQDGELVVDIAPHRRQDEAEKAIVLRHANTWTMVGRDLVAYYLLGTLQPRIGAARPLSVDPSATTDLVLAAPTEEADGGPRTVAAAAAALRVKGRYPRLHLLVPGPVVVQNAPDAVGTTLEVAWAALGALWAARPKPQGDDETTSTRDVATSPAPRLDAAIALHDALIGVETGATLALDLQKIAVRGSSTSRRRAIRERLRPLLEADGADAHAEGGREGEIEAEAHEVAAPSPGVAMHGAGRRDDRQAPSIEQRAGALIAVLGRFPDTVERAVAARAVPLMTVYGDDLVAATEHVLDVLATSPDKEGVMGRDLSCALAQGAAGILDTLDYLLTPSEET